jgi:hypothetical protein
VRPNTDTGSPPGSYARLEMRDHEAGDVEMQMKKPWEYISRDMNWSGVTVALVILGLLIADLAILGSTLSGYVAVAVIVVVSGTSLRLTAHRRSRTSR